jgi:hypothetical protein
VHGVLFTWWRPLVVHPRPRRLTPPPTSALLSCPLPVYVCLQGDSGSDGDSEGHDLRRIRPSPVDSSSMRVVGTTGWQAPELLQESLLRSSSTLATEEGFTLVGARPGDGPPSGARCAIAPQAPPPTVCTPPPTSPRSVRQRATLHSLHAVFVHTTQRPSPLLFLQPLPGFLRLHVSST